MKIGMFTDTYYPQINGVATSTQILAKELAELGHKVYIFTTSDPNAKEVAPFVYRLPSIPFVFLKSHRVSIVYSHKTAKAIKKIKLDVIHTQTEFSLGIFGRIVAKRFNIPVVHTYHTMYPDYVHYIANGYLITPNMAEGYSRIACNLSQAVIAPTDKVREFLKENGVKRRISVIPTGIDFKPFDRNNFSDKEITSLKKRFNILEQDKIILSVGRIAKEKSIDVIIKAIPDILKKEPDVKMLIVGEGPLKTDLKNLAHSLGISDRVIFTGEQPWEKIGLFYALGDIFVSASTTEAQGLTFMEAMAAGLPVAAKKDKCLEGIVIDEETGRVFTKDSDAAGVILELITDTEKSKEYAKNAYDTTKKFSSIQFAVSVLDVYNYAIAVKKRIMDRKKKKFKFGNLLNSIKSKSVENRFKKD